MKLPGLEFTLAPPRTYVARRRYHHGLHGVLCCAVGVICIVTDWHDRKLWIKDFLRHPDWIKF